MTTRYCNNCERDRDDKGYCNECWSRLIGKLPYTKLSEDEWI